MTRFLMLMIFASFLIAFSPFLIVQSLAQCGPGVHWIDQCQGGQDTWQNLTAEVAIDIDLDCNPDVFVPVTGWAIVQWSDPLDDSQNFPGTRPVDGHLDVIDTEIIQMELTGSGATVVAGDGQGQGGVLPPSPGVIAEVDDGEYTNGESYFSIFAEADMLGMFIYNHDPVVVEAIIDQIPPYGATYTFTGCIPAYDSPEPGQGNLIGNITGLELTIPSSAPIPTLSEWGKLIMGLLLLAFGTVAVVRRREAIPSRVS